MLKPSRNRKLAKARADKYFSLYIRQRDAVNGICTCVTCHVRGHWKTFDCGHFISRRYEATRYDEKNAAAQSQFANRFNQGMQFQFGLAIDKRWGKGTAEKLLLKSKMTCKRTRYDYDHIANE